MTLPKIKLTSVLSAISNIPTVEIRTLIVTSDPRERFHKSFNDFNSFDKYLNEIISSGDKKKDELYSIINNIKLNGEHIHKEKMHLHLKFGFDIIKSGHLYTVCDIEAVGEIGVFDLLEKIAK